MPKENKKLKIATKAPGVLEILWEQGFFRTQKDQTKISKRLGELGYNFSAATLGMALGSVKYLTRWGKRGSYEYIQKHPYLEKSKK